MKKENDLKYEQVVLQNLDAAYNLARWLLGNDQDAEDVVQDSAIRAFDTLRSFRGTHGKAWFLAIVRNASYNGLRQRKSQGSVELISEEIVPDTHAPNPQDQVIRSWEGEAIRAAVDGLPVDYREIIVLREVEDMSYKEIASVTGLPIGTVMSRLSRARDRLQASLRSFDPAEVK